MSELALVKTCAGHCGAETRRLQRTESLPGEKNNFFHIDRMDGEHSALSGVEREREKLPPIYNSSHPAVRKRAA